MATKYIEYKVAAVGDRAGLVVLRPETFDPTIKYRLIIFNPGIGGRGDGSDKGLDKISINDEGYTMTQLETAIKTDGRYILVAVQPRNLYENGETEEGRIWALNEFKYVIDPERVYLTGLSLGGGGDNRYLSEHADSDKKFAAVLTLCPGGNSAFIKYDGYVNIANTKLPILLVHCINDTVVKPEESTFPLVKKIKELNPAVNVQVILFKSGGHSAWKVYGQKPMCTPLDSFDKYNYLDKSYPAVNDVIGGFIDFFELNRIGQEAKFLPRLSDPKPIPPVEVPVPIPEPPKEEVPPVVVDPVPAPPPVIVPPANKIGISYVLQNATTVKNADGSWENNTNVTVYWADGKEELIKIPEGYRNAGTWENKKAGTYTLDIKQVGTGKDGDKIIIGPYRKINGYFI